MSRGGGGSGTPAGAGVNHLRLAAVALAAAVAAGLWLNYATPGKASRPHHYRQPNIVVVMTDDQALSQMRSESMPKVTSLLAGHGTTFDDAIVTTPLCCPSRASLETGQYGHNNGVLANNYHLLRHKGNVLPVWLRRAGYVTAHVGKFLNRYTSHGDKTAVAPGWVQWRTLLAAERQSYYDYDLSVNGRRVHFGKRDSDYATRVLNRASARLVRRYVPRKRPLYLELDQIAPHHGPGGQGTRCQGAAVPDPRDTDLFKDEPLPQPPSFNEANMADKPPFMQALPPLTQNDVDQITREYRCGLASLREVDRGVARIWREIKRLGELGRTVFIFYTDNGVFFGEHRIKGGKQYPYEEAVGVPLIMRVPARYRKGAPRVAHVSKPVANIDFAPTILRLAHARPCRAHGDCRVMDGRSLLGLVRGKIPRWTRGRALGVELNRNRASSSRAVCRYAGVELPGAVFVRHSRIKDVATRECTNRFERERYDLGSDPFELHNLCFGGSGCPSDSLQRKLHRRLARLHHCAGIAGRDPRPRRGAYCY